MPTTTKMGIVYPSSTDLVKDGATAMGTISTTVDSKTGLVLINTTTFTNVASQSVNNVFSATYNHYLIQVRFTAATNGSDSDNYLRLRTASTDESGSIYRNRNIFVNNTGSTGNYASGTQSYIFGTPIATGNKNTFTEYIVSYPFNSAETLISVRSMGYNLSAFGGTFVDSTTSYLGFSCIMGLGNFTGSVSTFGINL